MLKRLLQIAPLWLTSAVLRPQQPAVMSVFLRQDAELVADSFANTVFKSNIAVSHFKTQTALKRRS